MRIKGGLSRFSTWRKNTFSSKTYFSTFDGRIIEVFDNLPLEMIIQPHHMKYLICILTFITLTSFTVYGQTKNNIDNKQTIQNIKVVFDEYIKYQESTDSKADKDIMTSSLRLLDKLSNHKELEVLINVWMYYDPTDFPSIPEIDRILKISKPESIEAVKKRIANKKKWESEDSAPYSDLKILLKQLENE